MSGELIPCPAPAVFLVLLFMPPPKACSRGARPQTHREKGKTPVLTDC
jgi:hypothetical protein